MPETTPHDTTLRVWLKPALLGLTLGVALAATPSMAQSSLEQRVERIEERLNGSALMGLMNQADTLRSEVTTLRGEIEVLQRQIDDLRDQQRQIYLDLDERLLSLEANPGNGDAISSETTDAETNQSTDDSDGTASDGGDSAASAGDQTGDEGTAVRAAYQAAFDELRQGEYAAATSAFEQFLADHPDADLAANARYWLGESYYVVRAFSDALTHFQAVMDNHPESNKRPDALLKIGFVHFEQGRLEAARDALEQVINDYPNTTAANLATQRLDQL